MRAALFLLCSAVAGCASSGTTASSAGSALPETVRVSAGGSGNIDVRTNPSVATHGGTISAPLDRAWGVMRAVYDSLGIAVNTVDPAHHVIANSNLHIRRRLGDVPLSKYLNCGNTQGTPSADTYDVQLSIGTEVRSAASGGGSSIQTTIDAHAKPITISGEYVQCTSTSLLEMQIVEVVKAKLAR